MTRACERRQHGARGGRVLGRVTVRRSGAGDIRLARAPFAVDLPIEGISHDGRVPRPEVGTATRWREAVVGAWAVPAVHAGTLGSCFILVGSLTPAFLPADNAFNHVWLLRELQHGAGRVLATAVLLFGVLILLWGWLRLHPPADGVDVSRAPLALWGLPLCYGVIDFAAHNGLVAFGVSGGLALLWVATGHDRELVHPGDPRRPHRTWPELVHSSAQMSVRRAGSDAVPET